MTAKRQHVVMLFRFGGIRQAYKFRDTVMSAGVPAEAGYQTAAGGWYVKTDSRCLQHATDLHKLIYNKEAAN